MVAKAGPSFATTFCEVFGQRLFFLLLGITLFASLTALLWSVAVRANSWAIQDLYYTVTAFLLFLLSCACYSASPRVINRVLGPRGRLRDSHFFADAISVMFLILTTYVIFFCFCYALRWTGYHSRNFLAAVLFSIEFLLIVIFTTNDILIFYTAFELSLMPLLFMIIKWGSRRRKFRAAYYMFVYTIFGSVPFLIGCAYAVTLFGTTNFLDWTWHLLCWPTVAERLWWLLAIALLVKVPIMPFHLWLPEAHVEAPAIGSIILAGLLLKVGVYGLIRFHVLILQAPVWPSGLGNATLVALASMNIMAGSLVAIRQVDLKKLIAYSSVCHVGFTILALFAAISRQAFDGAVLSIFSHALVSSGLFGLVGFIYERTGTRDFQNYTGFVPNMPWWVIYFFLMTLANVGFPGTLGFVAEYLMLTGLVTPWSDFWVLCVFVGGLMFVTCYSMVAISRMGFGQTDKQKVNRFIDLDWREHALHHLIFIPVVVLGFLGWSYDVWARNIVYIV